MRFFMWTETWNIWVVRTENLGFPLWNKDKEEQTNVQ